VFVWETTLSRFLSGIRSISIRHYSQSLFDRMLNDPRIDITKPSAETTIWITIVALVAVCMALSVWRLRSMNLE
jgi:hypothetical protein